MERLTVTIEGDVQGVNFRTEVAAAADELALTGWVANEPDGSVRLIAEGSQANLAVLERWIREAGPGRPTTIDAHRGLATGEFSSFKIRR